MAAVSLQFQGAGNSGLLALLGIAICLALVAYGLWQLAIGRRRRGAAATLAGVAAAGVVALAAGRVPTQTTGDRILWLVLLSVLIVLAVGVFYSAVYAYLGRARIATLLLLRFLAILALLLMLFKPAVSFQPAAVAGKPALAVLLDRSASMGAVDAGETRSRYRRAVEAISPHARRMSRHFRVDWYHFADQPQPAEKVGDLAALDVADGKAGTDLAGAVAGTAERYDPGESAGIILITDGNHNAPGSARMAATEALAPIYAFGLGAAEEAAAGSALPNVRLLAAEAPLEAIQNNVTTITCRLRLTGRANVPARVVLTEAGAEVASREVLPETNVQVKDVALDWTPGPPPAGQKGPDVRKLQVLVQPGRPDSNPDDNAAELHVRLTRPRIRVLYVEGTLRPEYKFLRRVLSADPNVQCMSLVRLQGDRFLAQGSVDGKQLARLPRDDQEFQLFDVLILGDVERSILSDAQTESIRRFVSDGRALLMLGGRSSFGPGGYGGTPVESALPVFCGGAGQRQETARFVPQLTAEGVRSPIFTGLQRYFHAPGAPAAEPLPELLGCVRVPRAKPHATVLAVHPTRFGADGSTKLVVLAVHQYGKGRAAAFTADTTWQWYMRLRPMGTASPYHRFWGQLIRYLAGVEETERKEGPLVLGRLETPYLRQDEQLNVTAQVRDADGRPAAEATVSAVLRAGPEEKPIDVKMKPSKAGDGLYEGSARPERPGKYTLTVTAADKQANKLGQDELPVVVGPHYAETEKLARNDQLLRDLAAASEGEYLELMELPLVIDELIERQQALRPPPPRPREYPFYNFTILFLVFVGLLTAEWLIRRSWQLQ